MKNSADRTLYYLIIIQLLQSFIFYGMRSVFLLYFKNEGGFSDYEALNLYGNVMVLFYIVPFWGGILIDRQCNPSFILYLTAVLTAFGTLLLTSPLSIFLYIGLSFFILGQGIFKPLVPFLLDNLYKEQEEKKQSSYISYYLALNIGALISPFLGGILHKYYGFRLNFLLGAFISLIVFLIAFKIVKKEKFFIINNNPQIKDYLFTLLIGGGIYFSLQYSFFIDNIVPFLLLAFLGYLASQLYQSPQKSDMVAIIICLSSFCCFVMLFEQIGGSILLFIEHQVDRKMGGISIPSSIFLGLNPLLLLILNQLLSFFSFGKNIQKLPFFIKISLGFFAIGVGFFILSLSAQTKPGISSLLFTLFLHALGELLIVPTIIFTITKLAPLKIKGKILGLMGISIAFGHFLASFLVRFNLSNNSKELMVQAGNFQSFFFLSMFLSLGLGIIFLGIYQVFYKNLDKRRALEICGFK